jgi:hypothetical protein
MHMQLHFLAIQTVFLHFLELFLVDTSKREGFFQKNCDVAEVAIIHK